MILKFTIIISIICIYNTYSQEIKIKGHNGNGVPSLLLLKKGDKVVAEFTTDEYGIYNLKKIICEGITSLEIRAISSNYKNPYPISCIQNGEIIIPTIREFSNLKRNSNLYAVENSDFNLGVSLLAMNELVQLSKSSQLLDSDSFETKVIELAALYFEIDINDALYMDPIQEKNVASQNLKYLLIEYQKENSLNETGKLDVKTISSMANLKPSNVIFHEIESKIE